MRRDFLLFCATIVLLLGAAYAIQVTEYHGRILYDYYMKTGQLGPGFPHSLLESIETRIALTNDQSAGIVLGDLRGILTVAVALILVFPFYAARRYRSEGFLLKSTLCAVGMLFLCAYFQSNSWFGYEDGGDPIPVEAVLYLPLLLLLMLEWTSLRFHLHRSATSGDKR